MDVLNAFALRVTDVNAIIVFETKHYQDDRKLLGYVLHYIEAKTRDVQMYERRDGCGVDNWKLEDISKKDDSYNMTHDTVLIGGLMPNRLYAYFIKTYTIASEKMGGQTAVQYFRTRPAQPEAVLKLTATPQDDSSLVSRDLDLWCFRVRFGMLISNCGPLSVQLIKWRAPTNMNGNFSHYVIKAEMSVPSKVQINERDYCLNRESSSTLVSCDFQLRRCFTLTGVATRNLNNSVNQPQHLINILNTNTQSQPSRPRRASSSQTTTI